MSTPLSLLLLLTSACASPPDTLKLVSVLYRHGDRSPVTTYPNDVNNNNWPDGLGWLSNTGKRQQYELGQWLGKRYGGKGGFLNTTRYNSSEILVQASGVPRCLASAYSNLAGLFPPQGDQAWNDGVGKSWQPVPVQTTPQENDHKLAMHGRCPRYDELKAQKMSSPRVSQEEMDNKDFYAWVANKTGVKYTNLEDIWMIHDPLFCETTHNMTVNKWAQNATVWRKLEDLATWSFDLLYGLPEMARLKGGPLLGEIVTNMQAASLEAAPSPKFYMYSAHDTTVAALLSAMQVFDCHQPPYRALVMVELHKMPSGHVVKVFYKNDTSTEPTVGGTELFPPGCEKPCTLDTFVRVAKQRIPEDWAKECQISGTNGVATVGHHLALITLALFTSKAINL